MDGVLNMLAAIGNFLACILGGIAGAAEGFFKCIYSYFSGYKYSVHKGISSKAKSKYNEPAKEKYFFYKQYEDLKNTFKSASSVNVGNILLLKQQLAVGSPYNLSRVKTAKATIYVLGYIINVTCYSMHFIIVTIISIPIFICYFITITLEKIKHVRGKVYGLCPNCYSKFDMPYYLCPRCGRLHKKLIPGPYGILKRTCICGEIIPVVNFMGRFKFQAVCPSCLSKVESMEYSPVCIPIVGGKSAGKTFFTHSMIDALINNIAKEKKWNIRFLNSEDEKDLNTDKSVYNVLINSSKFSSKKLLYIYDIEGECFEQIDSIRKQKYYKYINGLIFVIDPLSIGRGAKNVVVKGGLIKDETNSTDINDLMDRFIVSLRELQETKFGKPITVPIAVVVNKMDLVNYKGDAEGFLKDIGEEKIIKKIECNFSNYSFFYSSVLETNNDEQKFKGQGVLEPVKWILSQANKDFM